MNKLKKNSIQLKFLLFFGTISITLSLIIGFIFFRSTKIAIDSSKEKEFLILSEETANKIERFLFERYGDIQVMANSPLINNSDIGEELKQHYIQNVRQAYKTYDYILICNLNGSIQTSAGSIKNDLYYKDCLKYIINDNIYVSDFFYSDIFKGYGVYFAAPVKDNHGHIIGAVIERMNFNSIYEIVNKVKMGQNGRAYLVQNNGNTIYCPYGKKINYINTAGKDNKILYPEHNNMNYILAYSLIPNCGTQKDKWYLAVEEPANEAFQVLNNIRNYTVMVILISIFVILVFSAFISKKMTSPIKKLLTETQNVARGNLSKNIKIMTGDEIGSLAESFNIILSNLKAMMQQVLEISGEAVLLNEVRQYAEKFFDEVPSAIIIIDNSGVVTNFNSIASEVTGINEEEIITKNIYNLNINILNPIFKLMKDGLENEIIYIKHIIKIAKEENIEISIVLNTSIQRDNTNNIIGIICVFKSIKQVNALEESIIRAKNLESLGELAAGMAHEIRNPLTSIKGYAQYLKMESEGNINIEDDVDIIISEVERLNGIIDRFLIFARPNKLKTENVNINQIVKNVIMLINKEAKDNDIIFKECLNEIPSINVDVNQIEQVFLNIIINAVQAMPNGGNIKITTEYLIADELVQISVEDFGKGIKSEDYDKIFEPFYTTKEKGTGLGLAICARIIENHRGTIEVSSTLNVGTKVIIKLPKNVN